MSWSARARPFFPTTRPSRPPTGTGPPDGAVAATDGPEVTSGAVIAVDTPSDDALSPRALDALAGFERFLTLERGRSAHTVRAYLGDVRALLGFAGRDGADDPAALDLAVLREWLAALTADGLARTTVARRGASARAFTGWLRRTGRADSDPGARLRLPPPQIRP